MDFFSKITINLINVYQRLKKTLGLPGFCRFSPTCSQYTIKAISRHGMIKGIVLGFRRVTRCHPWSRGGYDPLSN